MTIRKLTRHAGTAATLAVSALVVVAVGAGAAPNRPLTAYQQHLQTQVQTVTGAPISGRDPGTLMQSSLKSAAETAIGRGLTTNQPAKNVKGDHSHHVLPSQILPSASSGLSYAGCILGYAKAGQICVTKATQSSGYANCTTTGSPCVPQDLATLPKKP